VVVLELGGAQVAERGVEPPRVADVVGEAWEIGRDVLESLNFSVFMKLSAVVVRWTL
jgi:hypothetical protein